VQKGVGERLREWSEGEGGGKTAVAEPTPIYEAHALLAEMDALETAMQTAARNLEFEKAAQLRDRIAALRLATVV
jgi:excinuclease UvrABC helicase subunit UvrB